MGKGLGYVAVHLLGSSILSGVSLWTADHRLAESARALGICYSSLQEDNYRCIAEIYDLFVTAPARKLSLLAEASLKIWSAPAGPSSQMISLSDRNQVSCLLA